MTKVDELGRELLNSAGQRVGARARIETYTEVVPKNLTNDIKERPDGLISLRVGSREWLAFVEAKIGSNPLEEDQIERYRQLAKENSVDCLITISNQFSAAPTSHPLENVRKSRSKIPVIHWSWMHILTTADLLIGGDDVADQDQKILLNELRRFLTHESAGVRGFTRMPKQWTELTRLVSSGGEISPKSQEAKVVLDAWHQESKDLSLIMSRLTETRVNLRIPKKLLMDPSERQKHELLLLREEKQLRVSMDIPDTAAPLDIAADLSRKAIEVGMTLRAPEDKKSISARVNWLLRQIKYSDVSDLYIRMIWPGRATTTQHAVEDLRLDVDIAKEGKEHLSPTSFHIFLGKQIGAKFAQQANFIEELESIVPYFYDKFGSSISAWKKPAPQLKPKRREAEDVSTDAISEDAEAEAFEQ